MTDKSRILKIAIIVLLCVAIVLSAILIPLYFAGVIGGTPAFTPARQTEEDKEPDLDPQSKFFKAWGASSLPSDGTYATFTILYGEKTYTIKVYLFSDLAPKTVDNFVRYASAGLYDGTVFYDSAMTYDEKTKKPTSAYVRGGAYTTDDEGNLVRKFPEKYYGKLKGEFLANDPDTKNNISFVAGVLAMARQEDDYDSADTEFFFLSYSHAEYNGYYAAFGTVVGSDDKDDLIALTEAMEKRDGGYPVVIKSVKITSK